MVRESRNRSVEIMSKSKRKAQTPYGDVDFETNTCASCEQEYLPEDTLTAHVGVVKSRYNYSREVEIKFRPSSHRELHFCETCAETPLQLKIEDSLKDYQKYLTSYNLFLGYLFVMLIVTSAMMVWSLL